MTVQYILRKSLCRPAHCYSAWIKGQGYVNKGDNPETKADYDAQRMRSAESEIENLGYASSYAEPGYTQPKRGILFANWNLFPSEIDSILETAGYELEWSDEWSICDSCNKAVRTESDGYSWTPGYKIDDSGILCLACHAEENPDDDSDLDTDTD